MRARIVAEGLSKRYVIGEGAASYRTLREDLTHGIRDALRGLAGPRRPRRGPEEIWALRDASFEVEDGEVFGIIGVNGAGKSTLLKVLARIVAPTGGYAALRGRVGTLLDVAAGFHPELTGRDNVYMSGSVLGMSRSQITRRFDEIVEFSGVERFLDTPVKRYSTGMYLRLAFAVAAHLEADILMVDEAIAVGDTRFQQKCMQRMQELARDGRAVLFVSHNMSAVRTLCDRCGFLEEGRFEHIGPTDETIARYLRYRGGEASGTISFEADSREGPRMISASLWSRGETTGRISMGDDIAIDVEFATDQPIEHPRLGFAIHNTLGEKLLNANNRYQVSAPYGSSIRHGRIRCELGAVPLVSGRYSVSLYLGDEHGDTHVAEHALSFEILPRDIWGNGKVPAGNAHFWWPTRFRFYNGEAPAESGSAKNGGSTG